MRQVAFREAETEVLDEECRHWSPESERFAPGDALRTALEQDWQVHGVVFRQEHWHPGGRRNGVYHFRLERCGHIQTMVVVENPYVIRLLRDLRVQVVIMNQRKENLLERWS